MVGKLAVQCPAMDYLDQNVDPLFTSLNILQNVSDFPSHRILWHMYGALHSLHVICEMNFLRLVSL